MKDFTIDGFVTRNVEVRQMPSGQLVTKFSVNAPSYSRETQQSTPQFFDCEYWHGGPQDYKAANIAEGALLLLWGSLSYDSWTDQQSGQKRSRVTLKVRELGVIRPPQPRAPRQDAQQGAYAPQQRAYAPAPAQQAYAPAPQPAYAPSAPPQAPAPSPARPAPVRQAPEPQPQYPPVDGLYDEDIPF